MIYRIFEQDADTLLSLPETGMGYQIVNASQYERYDSRKFVVYNTNLAVELDSEFMKFKSQIIHEGYKSALRNAKELMLETDSIKVLGQESIRESRKVTLTKKVVNNRQSGGKGATDSPKTRANGNDIFVRISAFENDRRIDFDLKCLKPGSFTTTLSDYNDCISSHDDPVDRYALPNDETIKWAFYIKPTTSDFHQIGIVQPAFGHEGGGIEAYFEDGTSPSTYIKKSEYGQ